MEFTLTKHKLWRSCARKLVILGDEVLTLDGNGRTTNKLDLLRLEIEDGPGDTFTIQERAEGACGLPNLLGPRIFHFSAARKPEVLAALHKRDIFAARLSVEPRSGGSSPSAVGAPPVAASPDDAATPRAEAAACLAEAVEAILRPDGSSPGLLGCGLLGAEGLARAEAHNALFRKGLAANASGDSASAALDPRPTTILSHACYSRLLAEGSLTAKARAIAAEVDGAPLAISPSISSPAAATFAEPAAAEGGSHGEEGGGAGDTPRYRRASSFGDHRAVEPRIHSSPRVGGQALVSS
ncbi:hypothetical protein EMIHUDRAFT_449083 [Emiliania huxleyi CCMP1516]|uniref:Uncharacterized protein n=2 Tax=Emiliania huxleyi TaxID=2903 RepID=A0A0D3KLW1_EMIH1|nr:hypothetical protein EMIHUDRAFT_449083 [Emiliania huxleyi CCMP1516]EOD36746.1 hypothetical protein EMIHUDRAFT_449083 [Emiliania huxleyi CCMP1516]|eukprot:XP_005789175.1 hypothetical protein EMIHUDRAFT_449083 [Emiliania huxleyi CCMP1516]